jgi:hypothetical protein
MVAAIAEEEIAKTDSDSARIFDLPRVGSETAKAGERIESAIAGIESPDLTGLNVQQIDAAVGCKGCIAGENKSAKAAARLGEQTTAAGKDE